MARAAQVNLKPLLRLRLKTLATVLFFSVFTNLLMLTGPLFMIQVYDRVLVSRSEETLVALFLLVALLFTFFGLLDFARGRVMARAGTEIQRRLSQRTFIRAIQHTTFPVKKGASERAFSALEALSAFYTSPLALNLMDVPWSPLFLVAIFIFHPWLGWLALAGGVCLVLVALANQLMTARRSTSALSHSHAANALSNETLGSAEYVWAQGMSPAMAQRWQTHWDQALTHATRTADWTGSFSTFSKAFRLFLQSAILALGAALVLRSEITAGAMIAASILLGRALAPIEQSLAQ